MIKPFSGQALVEILPEESISPAGIVLVRDKPDRNNKQETVRGKVLAIGPWKKTKDGRAIMPEFKRGDLVFLSPYLGMELQDGNRRLRLVKWDDILALGV